MRIPTAWLREFIDVPDDKAGLEAFCDMLTLAGLEVEEILSTPDGPTLYTKITPNRGDWASVFGTAREAAAAGKLSLKAVASAATLPSTGQTSEATVTIEDAENCPRYSATVIKGVQIGPTPGWMQARLMAALGDKYKPINNVVDITNYVMLQWGQPLHAFDLSTLPGGQIVVRQARDGETLTTLDGVERNLAPGILCICDKDKPVAVAGVMGGGPTEITNGTTAILLESAHFNPFSIRRTAKRLGLGTEASYRYERFVDPALVPIATAHAAELITKLAGGQVVGVVDVVAKTTPPRRIVARVERVRKLLGADVDRDAMIAGLERLGISVERSAGALDCVVPSWRPDLTMEDDIAEEVGRISLGYENLPETVPPLRLEGAGGGDSLRGLFMDSVRTALVRAGLQEVLSHSLVAPSPLATPDEAAHRVTIRAALSPELSSLRTSLLPNLLLVTARAFAGGLRDVTVFEVGPVYQKGGTAYVEPLRIAGVVCGSAMPAAWSVKPDALAADFYFAKGVVEDLLAFLGISGALFAPDTNAITHPKRTAAITSATGETLGMVAELSEATIEAHSLPKRTCVFDLNGDLLLRLAQSAASTGTGGFHFAPLSKFPSITRDLAPVFSQTVPFGDVLRTARENSGPFLEALRLVDVYEGANVGDGFRSLTLRFTFRSPSATLKEADVEAALQTVRAALAELGADFRGA